MMKASIVMVMVATLVSLANAENFKYVHCCEYPELVDHEIGAKCPKNQTSGDDHDENMHADACQLNCVARELNLLDGNEFSGDKFNALVEKMAGDDSEAKEFYLGKMKECITKMEKHLKDRQVDHGSSECSKKTKGLMMCLGAKVAIECPDAKKVQSEECNDQRKFFDKIKAKYQKHEKH